MQLRLKAPLLDGVFHNNRDLLNRERLFDEIERAGLGSLYRCFNCAVAGDDDHFGAVREGNLLDGLQRFEAVHSGQPDIKQDEIIGLARQLVEALFAARNSGANVPFILQHAGERFANARFVIDYQNARPLHQPAVTSAGDSGSAAVIAGISTMNRAPAGLFSSTRMVALCSATMRLTIARPSPVPRLFVEK